jgi:hypothetical protein
MQVFTYRLTDAEEQLQALLESRSANDQTPRVKLDDTGSHLLSAGVIQYEAALFWYSLTGTRAAVNHPAVTIDLEMSTDSIFPEKLHVSCVVGESKFIGKIKPSMNLSWVSEITTIVDKRSKQVGTISISLYESSS